MANLEIYLPVSLVLIAFLLKLFMDRTATAPLLIRAIYELPVDIIFLSLSFITAATLSSPEFVETGLGYLFFLLIATLIIVVVWRRSITLFEHDHPIWSGVLFVLNASGSGFCLAKSISLLMGALA